MSDLISRQDAIDAIGVSWGLFDARKRVQALPSAEGGDAEVNPKSPYMQQSPNNGADLISRQAVIEIIKNSYYNLAESMDDVWAMVSDVEALPSAEAVHEWIPCSERLPSKDGCYLVSTTGTNNDIIDIAYYTEEIWHKASRIKAWMPLPDPYKGGDPE